MLPIRHLLNKIKWDKRENPEEYAIYYLDMPKIARFINNSFDFRACSKINTIYYQFC
ncbi:DUF504 domain-containing protein [Candidatus Pacearchaeota archaeon]|nr:DUF504 domain-containing protein [Candidatus Pacearchaeota archaeon]